MGSIVELPVFLPLFDGSTLPRASWPSKAVHARANSIMSSLS
jgi:hypothetical protein